MLQTFSIRYGNFRLIDIPGLKEIMPVTMETFLKHVEESSQAGSCILAKEWMKECCDIVDSFRDAIESLTPRKSVSRLWVIITAQ